MNRNGSELLSWSNKVSMPSWSRRSAFPWHPLLQSLRSLTQEGGGYLRVLSWGMSWLGLTTSSIEAGRVRREKARHYPHFLLILVMSNQTVTLNECANAIYERVKRLYWSAFLLLNTRIPTTGNF